MLDMLEALAQPRVATGNGLGIATMSGGAGVMMADRAEEVGLVVPELSPATRARIEKVMPAFGASANPVDVTGQFVAEPALLRESVIAMMDDPAIHVGIIWLQLMAAHVDKLVTLFCEIRDRTTKPLIVCWTGAPTRAMQRLREEGITVFNAGERAVEAMGALVQAHAARKRVLSRPTPALPPPTSLPKPSAMGVQPSVVATRWLSEAGVTMAPVTLARTADEAVEQWRKAGGAVALKIESPDITHKTEVGGVLLALNDEAALREGYRTLMERASRALPAARLDGVLVQRMAGGHVELVVGVQRSPVFGMVVMVGLGGILVEVLKDVVFRRAPFGIAEAHDMLAELKASAILDGVRGKPGVDRNRIAAMLSRLSLWAAGMEDALAELDLNPVLVGSDGPVAVDCVMVLAARD